MSEVIVGGNMASQLIDTQSQEAVPIQLCDHHYEDLIKKLGVHIDMHHQVFHVIAAIAGHSMGTVNVIRFKCPVCAMQEFDWIAEISKIVTDSAKTPKLVVPS